MRAVKITLGEGEYSLRELTAACAIRAAVQVSTLCERLCRLGIQRNAAEAVAQNILLCVYGLYKGDRRAFKNSASVYSRLTLGQIADVFAAYKDAFAGGCEMSVNESLLEKGDGA